MDAFKNTIFSFSIRVLGILKKIKPKKLEDMDSFKTRQAPRKCLHLLFKEYSELQVSSSRTVILQQMSSHLTYFNLV